MSTNGCRRFRGELMLAAFFLTGCGRAPSFDILGLVLSGLACVPGVGPGAHGGRSMAPLAPSHCDRASSFDLSEPDGALYFRVLARVLSIGRKS